MKTGLPLKQFLQSGDKCRLLVPNQTDFEKTVIFLNKSFNGNYLLQNTENKQEIIVCQDDTQFLVLPTENQLKHLIDVCLDLGWKDLFQEFSNQLLVGDFNKS
jgi:hypothetical protein